MSNQRDMVRRRRERQLAPPQLLHIPLLLSLNAVSSLVISCYPSVRPHLEKTI